MCTGSEGTMNNRKGFSTILVCVIVLILCMILAVLIEYGTMYNCAEAEKTETQLKLDSMITSYAVAKYDALKQGKAYESYLSPGELVKKAYESLGFEDASISEKTVTKGNLTYQINRPDIRYLSEKEFGIVASFNVIVPFTVFGQNVTDITIPITIISKYTER